NQTSHPEGRNTRRVSAPLTCLVTTSAGYFTRYFSPVTDSGNYESETANRVANKLAVTKHGFHALTSNRNATDLSACRWLRAPDLNRRLAPRTASVSRLTCPVAGCRRVDSDRTRTE